MQKYFPIFLLIFIVFSLASCSTWDPWKADQIKRQAEADKLRVEAEQLALTREQQRQHAEDQHNLQMLQEQMEYERNAAVEQDVRHGWSMFIRWSFLVGTAVTVGAILIIGRNTVKEIQRVQTGFATAMIQAVDIKSRLIYLDDKGQFPALYEYIGHGKYTLTDLNSKVTMELDTRNEGDAQMISGAVAIRYGGVIAREARKTGDKDAAGVSLIQKPPIIEGTAFDVKTIARDLIKKDGDA